MSKEGLWDVIVVGAGLSGVLAMARLHAAGRSALLLEARPRLGGRIHTVTHTVTDVALPGELGGTWMAPEHQALAALVQELGLETVPQHLGGRTFQQVHPAFPVQEVDGPAFSPGTMRIRGGSERLIATLTAGAPPEHIRQSWPVAALTLHDQHVAVSALSGEELRAAQVIVAVPPQIVLRQITISPSLPEQLRHALTHTTTWMGHVGKCLLWYDRPFWRESGLSGSGFFIGHIVQEFHDGSLGDDGPGLLVGFLNRNFAEGLSPEERHNRVISQFEGLMPGAAERLQRYEDHSWYDDPWSASPPPQDHPPPLDPGRDALFGQAQLDGRLHWAASETAGRFPGYLEGAVDAAERSVRAVSSGHS